jgi:hypothetical protein
MTFEPIPDGVRVAVYNAMGGWGPYTVREIDELFRMYGFSKTAELDDVGGERRTAAESFQRCIDWGDAEQRRRYLLLVDDVLENYPDVDGKPPAEAKKVRRALQLAGAMGTRSQAAEGATSADDLWPVGAVRIFVSLIAVRKAEAHELAEVLQAIGYSCFVAHDQIRPSRSWLREIERALRSCDLLIAYVTPKFADSEWTDQEVGWALGRDLVVIPVSVDGEMPKGFLGTYQAVRRAPNQRAGSLGRDVCKAIVDAVFDGQRPAATVVRERVAALIAGVFCKVRSRDNARFWYQLVVRIPTNEWTSQMRAEVEQALRTNQHLAHTTASDESQTVVADAIATYLSLERAG